MAEAGGHEHSNEKQAAQRRTQEQPPQASAEPALGSPTIWRALLYQAGPTSRVQLIQHLQASVGNAFVQRAIRDAASVQRSPETDLIRSRTTWYGNLHEDQLGLDLNRRASAGDYGFVTRVLDALGLTDRDDVAVEMVRAANDAVLAQWAASAEGRRMLDRLFDELTSGNVSADESEQADRIMRAKSRRIPPEQFQSAVRTAMIFPYRLPGLTVLDDAPITAERRGDGRIWVKQPVHVFATPRFRAETQTLPTEVFTSGLELPENQIIGVKMYDLGGEVHYRPALYLVQLSNETTTTVFEKMGEAGALGLTLGTGALAGLGVEASMSARVLVWADRAAFALGTITSAVREHRGWIIERFGDPGRQFLHYVDIVNSAVALYGGARVVLSMGQLVNGLRMSYAAWRAAAHTVEAELTSTERGVVVSVEQQTNELLQTADNIQSAQVEPATRPAPDVPAGAESTTTPTRRVGAGGSPELPPALANKFSRLVHTSRQQALRNLLDEAREANVVIQTDDEAQRLLDWAAGREGVPPENYHAVTIGDTIFVRPQHAENVRVLREELIHVFQQRAGAGTDQIVESEIEARLAMIRFRHTWAITNDEVREMIREVRQMRRTGRY